MTQKINNLNEQEKTSRKDQRKATHSKLISLAREEFTKYGYEKVSLAKLVSRASLTRGALYHQFKDKKELFKATLESVQADIVIAIEKAIKSVPDEWTQMRKGCHAFIEAASRPELCQVVLIDGPAVLGWQEWRRIDEKNGIRELQTGLAELMDNKVIQKQNLQVLTMMLSGAMNEGALWVVSKDKRKQALQAAQKTIDTLLEGLLI